MKLHLPTRLRKALVATFVAAITYASGSALYAESYNLLSSDAGWTFKAGRNTTHTYSDGVISYGGQWQQGYATYSSGEQLYTVGADNTLTFTVSYQEAGGTPLSSIALVGASKAIVLGATGYTSSALSYGISDNTTADIYADSPWRDDGASNWSSFTGTAGTASMTASSISRNDGSLSDDTPAYTITGVVTKDAEGNYTLDLTGRLGDGDTVVFADDLALGTYFDINRVVLTQDGANFRLNTLTIDGLLVDIPTVTIEGNGTNDNTLINTPLGTKIILNLDGANNDYLYASGSGNTNTVANNVEIRSCIITNGNSDTTYKFTGTITGEGEFKRTSNASANKQHYIFTGDMSRYSGNMTLADTEGSLENADTLKFESNTSGTGTITVSGHNQLIVAGATMNNSEIDATYLEVSGDSTFTGDVEVSALLVLGADTTITNSGSFTFGEGALIDLSNATYEEDSIGNKIYTIFDGSGTSNLASLTQANIASPDLSATYSFDANTITLGFFAEDLTYSGGTLLWNTDEANKAFTAEGEATAFASGDMVTFAGDSTVTLGADIVASSITVNNGSTVSITGAGHSLATNAFTVNGTMTVAGAREMNAADVTINGTLNWESAADMNISGTLTIASNATLKYEGATTLNPNAISVNGTLNVTGDNVLITKHLTGSGKLEVSDGGILSINGSGDQYMQLGTVNIKENSTLKTLRTDAFRWNNKTILTLEEGAEFAIGATRQTSGNLEIVMNGGTISGVGVNHGGGMSALDYHASNTITVNADSTISANIKVQSGKTLTLKVAEGKTLTMSGVTHNSGKLILAATTDGGTAGTMLVTGANLYSGGTDINSGTIELQKAGALGSGAVTMAANTKLKLNNAAAITHANAITGDATSEIIKAGSAAITLSGVTNFAGTVRISGGSLGFTQAATLGALVTDGGSLLVDAAAPAVLTLGATPTGTTSLLVKNAASIADGGVRIFADGTPMPGNSSVLVNSVISTDADGNEWQATYANGMLTKTTVTAATGGNLTWKADGASNNWGATTEANWAKDSTAQRWVDGSAVTFAGSGESINVVSAVTAASAAVAEGNYEWVLGADKLTITNGVTIAENASLTLTGLTVADSGNYSGVVTGAGTLVLKNMGMKALSQLSGVLSSTAEQTIDTVVIAEGSALQITGQGQRATLNNITHLVVEAGGRFDNRLTNTDNATAGMDITIAGAGDASLPGKDGVTTGPAAALTFGHECTAGDICTMARKVILSADATIYVASSKTGDLTSGMTTADHTLTLIGGGTLQWQAAEMEATKIVLDAASTLALYRTGNESTADPVAANQMYEIGTLQVSGGTKLKATNHASCIKIGQLVGSGVWNMEFAHSSSVISSSIVSGNASYDGTINVSVTNNNTRKGVFGTDDHDALSKTVVNIGTVTNSGAKAGFILANDGSETIQIAGLATGADVTAAQALLISNDAVSIESDGDSRTLEIVGGGTNTFGGTVLAGVNLLMNGTGTQGFTGNMDAFNGTIGVQKGTLNLVGVGSASAISLAGGTTLGVTAGVSGKALSVAAVGAVLSADLTMAGGSLALGATDAEWAKTGGLSLDGHKLVIDSANLGALSANLGTEDYTGEVVQLLTNVAGIEDAAGNAISITGTTKVGDLFNTGSDTSLADYLLNWDSANGTLSLIMKGEIADLVWNDDSDNDEWKNAGTHTNWKDGSDDSRFVVGDNVSFSGSTGETVTIVDTVNPLNVTVSSGYYTWDGDGSVEAAGKLTVADNARLTISNTGNKKFAGGVEVGNSAVLSVGNLTGWSGTVSGAGCLELATGADVGALSQFVSSEKELGMLLLSKDGTSLSVSSADESLISKVGTLQVVDGANVKVTNDTQLDSNLTLYSSNGASSVEVAADKTATLSGTFTYCSSTDDVAAIKGAGTLVLTGGASNQAYSEDFSNIVPNEGTLSIESGTLKIDAANSTVGAHQLGSVNGAGTLLLSNGSVEVVSLADTITVEVVTEAAGDVVNVSGIDGSSLDSITLVQGSQLTGVTGDISVGGTGGTTSSMALTLDAVNVGAASTIASGKKAMIGQTGKLTINDGSAIELSVDAITTMLAQASANAESVYLHLTTGTIEASADALSALVFKSGATSINLLESFGVRLTGTEAGSLVLSGGANGIYATEEDAVVNGYKELSAYQSTVVAPDKSLELILNGAADDGSTAVVNNLIGGTDSTLLITNTDNASMARVELQNTLQDIDNPDPAEAEGADTEFAGNIDGTSGVGDVEIVISGDGTLTVGGNVNTAQLTMSEGGLTLNGHDNAIGTLADDGVAAGATTADSTLTVNDLLTVEDESELTGTSLTGDGTLSLKDTLKLRDAATLDGVAVELQKDSFGTTAALALDGVQGSEISALNGAGTLQGGNGADLTVTGKGGSFNGSLEALAGANAGATLKIAQGASQTLDRATGSNAWSVENSGDLTINITNPAVTSGSGTNKPLTLDTLTMKSGSTTTMVINTDASVNYLNLQELVVEDGATVALQSTGLDEVDFGGSITLAYAANGVTVGDDVNVELGNSAAFKKVKEAELVSSADGKSLVLQTTYHDTNQYEQMTSSGNGAAGAALLWSVNTGALPNDSALKAVDEAVNELYNEGTSSAASQAEKIMAAVAGSSTAILGSALSSDVERQLRAIRNRTTTMGVGQCEVYEGMPYFNAWLNAEGDHHEMDADGLASGYTRDSWGGTVGFDVDLTPNLTLGMAVTAMYGDIESDSADKADGDFDTQYISLFARYASSAWTHTFVATVGRADMTLDRTVSYGTGSYDTKGETEGTSFGFMYEVGRVISLTKDGDVCLQPVANVTFRHSSVDGYEESGCDATLAVDEQTYTAVTLGVGARLQAVIGTSIYNRASILEARALAKFDMGDRESEADVRLTQGGNTATVKSAEVGAFGAEFGVGVTVPMGTNAGSIFVDGSAEIRSGYTNINGTVGYRINF